MDLPGEVLLHVFAHLEKVDLLNAALVSRKWAELAGDGLLWRELAHHCRQDLLSVFTRLGANSPCEVLHAGLRRAVSDEDFIEYEQLAEGDLSSKWKLCYGLLLHARELEINTFGDQCLGLADQLLRGLHACGFEHVTDLQARAVHPMSRGVSCLVTGRNGVGKMTALIIAMVHRLTLNPVPDVASKQKKKSKKKSCTVRSVCLNPTRELCYQFGAAFGKIAQYTSLSQKTVVGGVSIRSDVRDFAATACLDLVCATPGRFLNLCIRGYMMSVKKVEIFAMYEADSLVSMGLSDHIRSIVELLPASNVQYCIVASSLTDDLREITSFAGHDLYQYVHSLGSDT